MKKLLFLLLIVFLSGKLSSQTYPDKIGIGLSGIGGFGMEFTDVSKTMRSFDGATIDANGYPKSNFTVTVFDMRPCCPWNGSVDDPDMFVPALMSGPYKLLFKGKATVTGTGDPVLIQNQKYDDLTNTTSLDMVVQRSKWQVSLSFTNSQRTGTSAAGTGVSDIKLLRPGYHNRPGDIYRQEFINAVSHFSAIRFMDFEKTNNSNPNYPSKTEWSSRTLTTSALFYDMAPWEWAIKLANLTGKDMWINVPVAASDDYVSKMATLIRDSLTNPDCKIYIEYSNEVWNGGFQQYTYNRKAAVDEVSKEKNGGTETKLNDEAGQCDRNDTTLWCGRRYVKRLKEIGDIFVETFSPGDRSSFGSRIRPVFAWQFGGWIPYYSCILTWFEYAYGAGTAKDYFYGLAAAAYVNADGASANASAQQILDKMRANSDQSRGSKRDNPNAWTTGSGKKGLKEIAGLFQIKMLQYEMGPDNGGGDPANIANRIAANRDPGMKDLLIHELKDNWFADPDIAGDLSMYFVLSSSYTRYGSWGATEEVENMHTPKLRALYQVTGITEDITGPSVPQNVQKTMVNNDAIVTWDAATDDVGITHYRISDNTGALATVLANEPLTVTLKNYNQINLNSVKVVAVDAFNNISGFTLSNEANIAREENSLVYPNPVTDNITTIFLAKKAIGSKITLVDPTGKERAILNHSQKANVDVDFTGLASGIYILRILNRSYYETLKIFKP